MKNPSPALKDSDNIDCHLQAIGMGSLMCKAAVTSSEKSTNEIDPQNCFECVAGKIYREIGCDAVLPQIRIFSFVGGSRVQCEKLLCKLKKRYTTYSDCKACNLKAAETTKTMINIIKGLFTDNEFYTAYKDIEKARESIRDGKYDTAITNSLSSVESTMRIIHEKIGAELPTNKSITDLFKSTRNILKFDEIDHEKITPQLINNLHGLIASFGGLRNALSDAHGRGNLSGNAQEYIAELAINTSSTLSTVLVRRFNEIGKL